MAIEVVNSQRKIRLEPTIYRDFAQKVLETVEQARGKTATVAFVSDRRMQSLNKEFRAQNKTTDVLSFPHEPDQFEPHDSLDPAENAAAALYLGDIVISAEQASRQADEHDLPLELEIKQLILHSVLHLCGYDHEIDTGEMNKRELELRDKLGIS